MAKDIKYNADARDGLIAGIDKLADTHIELERAYAQVMDNGQINMALCCDFLSRRLSLHTDVEQRYTFAERYAELLQYHDASWINIWCATSAYYHNSMHWNVFLPLPVWK